MKPTIITRHRLDGTVLEEITLSELIYNRAPQRYIYRHGDLAFKFEHFEPTEPNETDSDIAALLPECHPTLLDLQPVRHSAPGYQISVMKLVDGSIDRLGKIYHELWPRHTMLQKAILKLSIAEIFTVSCAYLYSKNLFYVDTKPENIFYQVRDKRMTILTGDLGSVCCSQGHRLAGISYPILRAQPLSGKLYQVSYFRKPTYEDIVYGVMILLIGFFHQLDHFSQLFSSPYKHLSHAAMVPMDVRRFNQIVEIYRKATQESQSTLRHFFPTSDQESHDRVAFLFDSFEIENAKDPSRPHNLALRTNLDIIYRNILQVRIALLKRLHPDLDAQRMLHLMTDEYQRLTDRNYHSQSAERATGGLDSTETPLGKKGQQATVLEMPPPPEKGATERDSCTGWGCGMMGGQ
jgi:hypothetical protein